MQYFTKLDAIGLPVAFYNDDVWNVEQIPADVISITEGQWREFINNSGFRKWESGAVVPYEPPPVEPPFPSVVSASQAKIALLNAGLLDGVAAAIAAHPYRAVQIWYSDANQWERGHPYVQAIGAEMGLTDQAIDGLFIAASRL